MRRRRREAGTWLERRGRDDVAAGWPLWLWGHSLGMVQTRTALGLRDLRRMAAAKTGDGVLTEQMRRDGWRTAHEVLYDIHGHMYARVLHRPTLTLQQVAVESPGLARLVACLLEVPADAPVVRALERIRRDPLADASLTPREARAVQLRAEGCSWHEVACQLLCSRDAARDYVKRAEVKIRAARKRGLDRLERGLPHTHVRVLA